MLGLTHTELNVRGVGWIIMCLMECNAAQLVRRTLNPLSFLFYFLTTLFHSHSFFHISLCLFLFLLSFSPFSFLHLSFAYFPLTLFLSYISISLSSSSPHIMLSRSIIFEAEENFVFSRFTSITQSQRIYIL